MKANDNIPADEMLLAEAIAAAKAKNMGWASLYMFADENGEPLPANTTRIPKRAANCCAYGALRIAKRVPVRFGDRPWSLNGIATGNDYEDDWDYTRSGDNGESLGWAFRCAMTQEEP